MTPLVSPRYLYSETLRIAKLRTWISTVGAYGVACVQRARCAYHEESISSWRFHRWCDCLYLSPVHLPFLAWSPRLRWRSSGTFSLRISLPTKTPLDANHKVRIAARSGAHHSYPPVALDPSSTSFNSVFSHRSRLHSLASACTRLVSGRCYIRCAPPIILRILPSNVYEARSHHGTFRQAGAVPVWHFSSAANDVGVGRLRRFFRVWLLSFDFSDILILCCVPFRRFRRISSLHSFKHPSSVRIFYRANTLPLPRRRLTVSTQEPKWNKIIQSQHLVPSGRAQPNGKAEWQLPRIGWSSFSS